MHQISKYFTPVIPSQMALFTSNPFGYLLKIGETSEGAGLRSKDATSAADGDTVSDLQVRMMMWELEAYMNGIHLGDQAIEASGDLKDHHDDDAGNDVDGSKVSKFVPFSSLMTPEKQNSSLKNTAKRLKLERMCSALDQEHSTKVMEQLRECVLSAKPSLKPEKVVQIFEKTLSDILKEQKKVQEARRVDPRNMNKLSVEYLGNRVSHAVDSVSSFFAQHSGKVKPVVDFILGYDEDDDDKQVEGQLRATSSELPEAQTTDNRSGGNYFPLTAVAASIGAVPTGENALCSLRVTDETEITSSMNKASQDKGTSPHCPSSPRNKLYQSIETPVVPFEEQNSNNSSETGKKEEIPLNDYVVEVDKSASEGDGEVRVKSKPRKALRHPRIESTTDNNFVEITF